MPLDPDALAAMYGSMSERALQAEVDRALVLAGWLRYHTYDSRRSVAGFPDIVAIRGDRLIFRELKTQKGKLDADQLLWGDKLTRAGFDWATWRPLMWGDGTILRDIERMEP